MSDGDGRIPLTIVGGYLGAGKSTWLRHMLHVGSFAEAHVLVNEAAELPVDHLLLKGAGGLTVLPDGCACCEGAARFVAVMRKLCDRNVPAIVLETSGVSDPAQIAAHIARDGVLARRIRVTGTIVVADALHAAAQLQSEPLWRRQVEAADRIVLTKADLSEPSVLARLAATMAVLNPDAVVSGAVMGSVVDLPDAADAAPFPVLPASKDVPPLGTLRLFVGPNLEWAAISAWLSAVLQAHGEALVRVKGVVRAPIGRLLLQAVRGRVQPPEILPEDGPGSAEDNFIVLIGRNMDSDRIRRSFSMFTS